MPRVVIDDIEYVPRAEIPPLVNEALTKALKELESTRQRCSYRYW